MTFGLKSKTKIMKNFTHFNQLKYFKRLRQIATWVKFIASFSISPLIRRAWNRDKVKFLAFASIMLMGSITYANKTEQTVRGQIIDGDTKTPLIGANVIIAESDPPVGTVTDLDGNFRLESVPVGRMNLVVSYVGYNPQTLANVVVQSGRETVLNIELEEAVTSLDEVVVRGRQKNESLNEMATVSARQFTVEETGRYAGSRNDVSRMAANFAGVTNGDDARNDIVIRGNSPTGLLWRLNGMDIPDPNHFSGMGSNGGPVSMLNYNVLANSDFMTGAFPSEYGNAISGAFDINMRRGNNEQREYMFQFGSMGTEFMAEGPFTKNYNGSYLVNYRFSTTTVMTAMGIDFGYDGQADYQDLTYNFDLPLSNGNRINLFGLWGNSDYKLLAKNKSEDSFDVSPVENSNQHYITQLRAFGANYFHRVNDNSYLNLIVGVSGESELGRVDSVSTVNEAEIPNFRRTNNYNNINIALNYTLKLNARNKIITGVSAKSMDYKLDQESFNYELNGLQDDINNSGQTELLQGFAQWKFKPLENLQFIGGLHYQYLNLNQSQVVEPRAGLRYTLNGKHIFKAGYGKHSQTQPLFVYFLETQTSNDPILTNKNLDFSKSDHYVFGYQTRFGKGFSLKTETYYQDLYDIPVHNESNPTSFSLLNEGADYFQSEEDSLVNEGIGRNYGLEITLEKFFSNTYYFLITSSLYNSEYHGSDGIWRNTGFNGNYVVNVLAGKEFQLKNNQKLIFDFKITTAGGRRYTPVDREASIIANETVYEDDKAFSKQHKPYFRMDLKATYRIEMEKVSHEFFINVDNVFNTQNIYLYGYNRMKDEFGYVYQLGIFPTFQYKIYF